ncbi:MAG: acetylornithine deacetylase [Beijerinckiaceae bacterium]
MSDIGKAIDILSALVAFDTTSRNSNLPCIAWVENYLADLGVRSERVPDETGTKANLWATVGPEDVPGYVLSGHVDVVPVDGQAWSTDPFVLTRKDDRLYGRGAADMKGFDAVCLAMVPAMLKAGLKRPIHIALSHDEEIGCVGVRSLLRKLAVQPVKPLGCFVGEPSNMQVIIGHKSGVRMLVKVRGHSVHSSLAPQGVNAVEWGARVVAHVQEIAARLARDGARDPLYDMPHTTMQVGLFSGGTAPNIVPQNADFSFEVRAIGADSPDAIARSVEQWAKTELEPRMQAVAAGTGFEFSMGGSVPGFDAAPDDPLVSLAKHCAGRNDHAKVSYGTEAGLFVEMAGIPALVVGPGSIEQAHKPDEFIAIAELESCIGFMNRLIQHCRN